MEENTKKDKDSESSSFGGLILLLIIAYFTAPDEQKHKWEVKAFMMEKIQEESKDKGANASSENEYNPFSEALASKWIENGLKVENYYVFSTSQLYYDGEYMFMGFGIFGWVFFPLGIIQKVQEFFGW